MALNTPTGQPLAMQSGEYAAPQPPNLVSFALQHVGPPSPIYIQRDDVIGITALSMEVNEVLNFSGRFLRASDGVIVPFTYNFNMNAGFNVRQFTIQMGEGYLLGLVCSTNVAQRRGRTFVSCSLVRGKMTLTPSTGLNQILFQDYCHQNTCTGWPGGAIADALSGMGNSNSYSNSNPAAGADFSISTPNNSQFYWAIVTHVTATLTTSATVANRLVRLNVGAQAAMNFGAIAAVPASTTVVFTWDMGCSAYADALGNQHLPITAVSQPGSFAGAAFCQSFTTNIQAGDQWSALSLDVFEWLMLQ